jgi:beta-lactamase superfamily II metal-dependent hydrolase
MPKMEPPASGVTVRMYRQGHGDCFLLAMRKTNGTPFYMLIDCGLWSNSELESGPAIGEVIADIATSTNKKLDVVVVTHEHMDHVNGFAKSDEETSLPYFDPIKIDQLWLAWTEDGDDEFANKLRERFNDTLLALMGADDHLQQAGLQVDSGARLMLRDLLSFETGEEAADGLRHRLLKIRRDQPNLSAREQGVEAIKGITNKRAIKYLREKVAGDPTFLRPDRGPYELKGVKGARVYALGPPRNEKQLLSLNPEGDEEFHLAIDGAARNLLRATSANGPIGSNRCFDPRFGISRASIENPKAELQNAVNNAYGNTSDDKYLTKSPQAIRAFFAAHYGDKTAVGAWRQIDTAWLAGSESLALRLNDEVNNTSLVIAIELPATGKVLLFPGDAQRGNWISWAKLSWTVGNREVDARSLLNRTVFYKVGHHGSHNATLNGTPDAEYANLSWLAMSEFKDEFVAMIPANTKWALGKARPWKHPLESIEEALHTKARGRYFEYTVLDSEPRNRRCSFDISRPAPSPQS